MTVPKGKFIVGNYEIPMDKFEETWRNQFIWMKDNGYEIREQVPFDIYHNNFNEHPEKKCNIEMFIPVN